MQRIINVRIFGEGQDLINKLEPVSALNMSSYKEMEIDGIQTRVQIEEQKQFEQKKISVTPKFDVAIVVVSFSSGDALAEAKKQLSRAEALTTRIVLACDKSFESETKDEVEKELKKLAASAKAEYTDFSSRNNLNITRTFELAAKKVMQQPEVKQERTRNSVLASLMNIFKTKPKADEKASMQQHKSKSSEPKH